MKRPPHAVRGAYDYADDTIPCPTCGAEPFVWCRQADGLPRHIPCVRRLLRRPDSEGPNTPPEVIRITRTSTEKEPE